MRDESSGPRKPAYRLYVAKTDENRRREMARAQKQANRKLKRKTKNVRPSELKVTTRLEDVASYSAPASEPLPAVEKPAFKESVVDPITVSASSTIPTAAAPQQQP